MAKLTGTVVTSDINGRREDLGDLIYDISPTETPFVKRGMKGTASAIFHEWQTDALAAASSTNAQPEGNNYTSFDAIVSTRRVGNYCQIFSKTVSVSRTTDKVKKAGRSREMALQTSKKMKEIKRDLEKNMLENVAASGTDPRKLAGMGAWLFTNTIFQTGGTPSGADPDYSAAAFPNAARTDNSATAALTETMLKSAIQSAWDNGGEPSLLLVGSANKQVVSGFTGIVQNTYDIAQGTRNQKNVAIVGAAGVYVSDFGALEVVPDRFQRARDAWVLDPNMYSIDWLDPLVAEPLAKTGDADNKLIVGEVTLKVSNEAAHAGIFDLS